MEVSTMKSASEMKAIRQQALVTTMRVMPRAVRCFVYVPKRTCRTAFPTKTIQINHEIYKILILSKQK